MAHVRVNLEHTLVNRIFILDICLFLVALTSQILSAQLLTSRRRGYSETDVQKKETSSTSLSRFFSASTGWISSKDSKQKPLHFGKNFWKNLRLSSIADPNGKNLSHDIAPGFGYINPSYLWNIPETTTYNKRKHLQEYTNDIFFKKSKKYITIYQKYIITRRKQKLKILKQINSFKNLPIHTTDSILTTIISVHVQPKKYFYLNQINGKTKYFVRYKQLKIHLAVHQRILVQIQGIIEAKQRNNKRLFVIYDHSCRIKATGMVRIKSTFPQFNSFES